MTNNSENIKCLIRLKPLNKTERNINVNFLKLIDDDNIELKYKTKYNKKLIISSDKNDGKIYSFNWIVNEDATQNDIFNLLGNELILSLLSGYNCTLFAYGQTGSGKTHTMLGPTNYLFEKNSEHHGILPRILNEIFAKYYNSNDFVKIKISCSCFEIYNENIIDLIASEDINNETDSILNSKNKLIKIREHPKKGMYVENIFEEILTDYTSAMNIILKGIKNRHVSFTKMNAQSSRSHLVFTLYIDALNFKNESIVSKFNLIDLAGSERQKTTGAVGDRIKEGGMINKSLSALGTVINTIVENAEYSKTSNKQKHIPYRDSKLTYLLKDSLGGNSKTIICANVSQSMLNISETISTLNFVQRANLITNSLTSNTENKNDYNKIISNLKKENSELKRLLKDKNIVIECNKDSNVKDCIKLNKKLEIENNELKLKLRDLNNVIEDYKNKIFLIEFELNMNKSKLNKLYICKRCINDKGLSNSRSEILLNKNLNLNNIYKVTSKSILSNVDNEYAKYSNSCANIHNNKFKIMSPVKKYTLNKTFSNNIICKSYNKKYNFNINQKEKASLNTSKSCFSFLNSYLMKKETDNNNNISVLNDKLNFNLLYKKEISIRLNKLNNENKYLTSICSNYIKDICNLKDECFNLNKQNNDLILLSKNNKENFINKINELKVIYNCKIESIRKLISYLKKEIINISNICQNNNDNYIYITKFSNYLIRYCSSLYNYYILYNSLKLKYNKINCYLEEIYLIYDSIKQLNSFNKNNFNNLIDDVNINNLKIIKLYDYFSILQKNRIKLNNAYSSIKTFNSDNLNFIIEINKQKQYNLNNINDLFIFNDYIFKFINKNFFNIKDSLKKLHNLSIYYKRLIEFVSLNAQKLINCCTLYLSEARNNIINNNKVKFISLYKTIIKELEYLKLIFTNENKSRIVIIIYNLINILVDIIEYQYVYIFNYFFYNKEISNNVEFSILSKNENIFNNYKVCICSFSLIFNKKAKSSFNKFTIQKYCFFIAEKVKESNKLNILYNYNFDILSKKTDIINNFIKFNQGFRNSFSILRTNKLTINLSIERINNILINTPKKITLLNNNYYKNNSTTTNINNKIKLLKDEIFLLKSIVYNKNDEYENNIINKKITLLMQIKQENYDIKLENIKLKEKNYSTEDQLKTSQEVISDLKCKINNNFLYANKYKDITNQLIKNYIDLNQQDEYFKLNESILHDILLDLITTSKIKTNNYSLTNENRNKSFLNNYSVKTILNDSVPVKNNDNYKFTNNLKESVDNKDYIDKNTNNNSNLYKKKIINNCVNKQH